MEDLEVKIKLLRPFTERAKGDPKYSMSFLSQVQKDVEMILINKFQNKYFQNGNSVIINVQTSNEKILKYNVEIFDSKKVMVKSYFYKPNELYE